MIPGRSLLGLIVGILFALERLRTCEGWTSGRATFYGRWDASGTLAGACGYGNVLRNGYGYMTAAASSAIWQRGTACGICLQVRCINTKTWKFCHSGQRPISITITNMCPEDWRRKIYQGAWCNRPAKHLDLTVPAFLKIAKYKAGIVPILYRRVPCYKWGGVKLHMQGNYFWMAMNIQNVAGPGNIRAVWFRPKGGRWIKMHRNWGVTYSKIGIFTGRAMSLIIKSYYTWETIYIGKAIPQGWRNGRVYRTNKQFSVAKMRWVLRGRRLAFDNPPEDFPKDLPDEFFTEDSENNSDHDDSQEALEDELETPSPEANFPLTSVPSPTTPLEDEPSTPASHGRFRVGKHFFPSSDELDSWEEETNLAISKLA